MKTALLLFYFTLLSSCIHNNARSSEVITDDNNVVHKFFAHLQNDELELAKKMLDDNYKLSPIGFCLLNQINLQHFISSDSAIIENVKQYFYHNNDTVLMVVTDIHDSKIRNFDLQIRLKNDSFPNIVNVVPEYFINERGSPLILTNNQLYSFHTNERCEQNISPLSWEGISDYIDEVNASSQYNKIDLIVWDTIGNIYNTDYYKKTLKLISDKCDNSPRPFYLQVRTTRCKNYMEALKNNTLFAHKSCE